ncbi:hypothetical protein EZV62_020433 [Acer yangbiense]|uniref:Uncharacterized protein n=1 Tax=Acer yangbiense TaxID=1000413 RepID=A0A5C7HE13_9ROSI|nr:hypothetical protein EZV62_020433 [Acer yangbiense]
MIVARLRTVGSYIVHPHSASVAAGDFNNHCFHFCYLQQMLSVPPYSTPSLPPKLLSNVVAPKMMLHKNPSRHWTSLLWVNRGFSVLASDCPWKNGSIWSTIALYMFNLHIPLGYGGLSIVTSLLEEPVLDPQTQEVSLPVVLMLELSGTLFLLSKNIKPQYDLVDFFKDDKISKERNWLLASALGFGFLSLLVFLHPSLMTDYMGLRLV